MKGVRLLREEQLLIRLDGTAMRLTSPIKIRVGTTAVNETTGAIWIKVDDNAWSCLREPVSKPGQES